MYCNALVFFTQIWSYLRSLYPEGPEFPSSYEGCRLCREDSSKREEERQLRQELRGEEKVIPWMDPPPTSYYIHRLTLAHRKNLRECRNWIIHKTRWPSAAIFWSRSSGFLNGGNLSAMWTSMNSPPLSKILSSCASIKGWRSILLCRQPPLIPPIRFASSPKISGAYYATSMWYIFIITSNPPPHFK